MAKEDHDLDHNFNFQTGMGKPMPDRFDEMGERISKEGWAEAPTHSQKEYAEEVAPYIAAALRQQHVTLKAESAKLREEYAELANLNLGLSVENAKLREAVTTAIGAISSLPPDALGIGNENNPDPGATRWYIRDEVLSNLRAALNEDKP